MKEAFFFLLGRSGTEKIEGVEPRRVIYFSASLKYVESQIHFQLTFYIIMALCCKFTYRLSLPAARNIFKRKTEFKDECSFFTTE